MLGNKDRFPGYSVVGMRIICQSGCLTKIRYWIKGWHPELANKYQLTKFINGKTGPETEVNVERIMPVVECVVT